MRLPRVIDPIPHAEQDRQNGAARLQNQDNELQILGRILEKAGFLGEQTEQKQHEPETGIEQHVLKDQVENQADAEGVQPFAYVISEKKDAGERRAEQENQSEPL